MTCESMRERLLTADLDELRGQRSGEFAEHLRGCPACRAEADRILRATVRLGEAVSGRRRRRIAAIVMPLTLAAGIMLAFIMRPRTGGVTPVISASVPISTAVGVESSPRAVPVSPVPSAGARPRSMAAATPVEAISIAAVAFAPPSSYAAEPLRSTAVPEQTAPGSSRPTSLRSSDPNITILWFQ